LPYNAISMYAYLFARYPLTLIHTERVQTNAPVEILDKALDEPQETRRTCRKACFDDCDPAQRVFKPHLTESRIRGDSQLPSAAAFACA
jgi:hypothetical protein